MKKSMIFIVLLITLTFSLSVVAAEYEIANQYDLNGETVKIMSWYEGFYEEFLDGQGKIWKEEVEEMFNCKIEFDNIPWNEQVDNLTTKVLAGDKPADLLHWQMGWLTGNEVFDFVMPMTNIVEKEYYDRVPDLGIVDPESFTIAGETYGIGIPKFVGHITFAVWWNKSLFERNNLPNLYELAENNEWTWDKMLEIAHAATKDTTGDGEFDQFGAWGFLETGPWGQIFVDHGYHWAYANDAPPIKEEDGKMVFAGTDPNFIEAVNFFADNSMPEGYTDVVKPDYDVHQGFVDGEVAMAVVGKIYGDLENMEDDWGIVPMPMGPSATDYPAALSLPDVMLMPLTVESERARAIIEVYTALFRTAEPYIDGSKEEFIDQAIEDWATENYVRDVETVKWAKYLNKNATYDFSRQVIPKDVTSTIVNAARGNEDPAAAIESVAPEVQSKLDDLFN